MRFVIAMAFTFILGNINAQNSREVKAQFDSLKYFVKMKGSESFALHTVYRGEDVQRKWKDVYDPSNAEELKAAKEVMNHFKSGISTCNYMEFDKYEEKKESEGVWHVLVYACGASKKIRFAFLKINGVFALGDIDTEGDDEE